MNDNFKKVMDQLAEFKSLLSGKKVATKFAEATLEDGTVIRYDAEELAPGVAVFVVADGEEIPAPEGTHRLGGDMAGISIVVDAEGLIAEVIDERTGNEVTPAEEEMSAEQVRSIVEAEVATFGKALKSLSGIVESIAKQNEQLSNELTSVKAEFTAYKNAPSNEVKEAEKFAKVNNSGMTSRQIYLLKQMKK
jgi:prophage DNA circulation protein